MDDNDGVLHFNDIMGESLYTNPPDPNIPCYDHRLEEPKVWAFRMTAYNQDAVINDYANNPISASQASHAPFWGKKLTTPAFYSDEKYKTFLKQWNQRLGLENIKMRHAVVSEIGNHHQRKEQKKEI